MECCFIPDGADLCSVILNIVLHCYADAGLLQVIVILAGTNNHDHTASQIVEGLLEIVKTCQKKQPQADVLVMVDII